MIEVQDGIVRKVDDRTTTITSAQVRSARKIEHKTITVTALPKAGAR